MSRYCYWSSLSKGICYVYCFSFAPSSKRRSRGPTSLLHSALRYPRLVNRSLFPRFFPAFSGARFFNGSIEPCCILWKFESYPRTIRYYFFFTPKLISKREIASGNKNRISHPVCVRMHLCDAINSIIDEDKIFFRKANNLKVVGWKKDWRILKMKFVVLIIVDVVFG